jgi:hypothetical protein
MPVELAPRRAGLDLRASVTDQNGNIRVCEHLIGYAPEQNRGDPAPPVRGHDDDIATFVLCSRDDPFIRLVMLELHGFTGDPRCLSCVGDTLQYSGSMFFSLLGVLGIGFGHFPYSGLRDVEDIERSLDDQRRYFSAKGLRQRQSMLDSMFGERRAVGCDQNVPIHTLAPPCLIIVHRPSGPSGVAERDGYYGWSLRYPAR